MDDTESASRLQAVGNFRTTPSASPPTLDTVAVVPPPPHQDAFPPPNTLSLYLPPTLKESAFMRHLFLALAILPAITLYAPTDEPKAKPLV